ncbi:MAG: TRAP transporter small permease [Rhodospirillales bacterium]
MAIRRILARLYSACGGLAAVFLMGVCLCSLYSIVAPMFGLVARSIDEFAGYSMATSSFLALAYTFGRGEHIRVTLVLEKLDPRGRRRLELWCLGMAAFLSGFFAFYSVKMTYTSWVLHDMSQGLVPMELWIPQIGMAVGTTVLFIAVLEKLVDVARGGELLKLADAHDPHADR